MNRSWQFLAPIGLIGLLALPLVQSVALALSPHRAEFLSYYFTLGAAVAASVVAAAYSRHRAFDRRPMLWLSAGLALWAAGLLSATVQVSFLDRLNTNTSYTYLLFVSYGIPLLYVAASHENDLATGLQNVTDAVLLTLLALIFYVGIQDVLDTHGELASASGRWVNFALDIENLFLCSAFGVRFFTAAAARERRYFGIVFGFLLTYAAAIALHNHWENPTDPRFLQYLGQVVPSVPFTALIVCIVQGARRPAGHYRRSPVARRISLSVGPALMLSAIFCLSFGVVDRHGRFGVVVVALAMSAYVVRTVQTQYGYVESREKLAEALQVLEQVARLDAITGIANRRAFDEALVRLGAASERSGEGFALLMIDVDFFKRYNDTYGHQAGDECLRRVAAVVAGSIRPSDFVARYGGEEFVVLLPGAGESDACGVAERVRGDLGQAALEHRHGIGGSVTVSIGIARHEGGADASVQGCLRRADEALYRAKAEGRDRAVGSWTV